MVTITNFEPTGVVAMAMIILHNICNMCTSYLTETYTLVITIIMTKSMHVCIMYVAMQHFHMH